MFLPFLPFLRLILFVVGAVLAPAPWPRSPLPGSRLMGCAGLPRVFVVQRLVLPSASGVFSGRCLHQHAPMSPPPVLFFFFSALKSVFHLAPAPRQSARTHLGPQLYVVDFQISRQIFLCVSVRVSCFDNSSSMTPSTPLSAHLFGKNRQLRASRA
jgi:hypothetical protein